MRLSGDLVIRYRRWDGASWGDSVVVGPASAPDVTWTNGPSLRVNASGDPSIAWGRVMARQYERFPRRARLAHDIEVPASTAASRPVEAGA